MPLTKEEFQAMSPEQQEQYRAIGNGLRALRDSIDKSLERMERDRPAREESRRFRAEILAKYGDAPTDAQ